MHLHNISYVFQTKMEVKYKCLVTMGQKRKQEKREFAYAL